MKKTLLAMILASALIGTGCANRADISEQNISIEQVLASKHTTKDTLISLMNLKPAITAKTADNSVVDVFVFNNTDGEASNFIPFNPTSKYNTTEKYLIVKYNSDNTISQYFYEGKYFLTELFITPSYKYERPLTKQELLSKTPLTMQQGIEGFYNYKAQELNLTLPLSDSDKEKLDNMEFEVPSVDVRATNAATDKMGSLHDVIIVD